MAISWNLEITNANLLSKRAGVTATRTDSESSLAPQVYQFSQAVLETPAERAKLLNQIKAEVEAAASKQDEIDEFIGTLEQDGKAALEAWEATR